MPKKIQCTPEFEFQCPKDWDKLDLDSRSDPPMQLSNAPSRFCRSCNQNVYLVKELEEFQFAIKNRVCIALDIPQPQNNLGGKNRVHNITAKSLGIPARKTQNNRMSDAERLDKASEKLTKLLFQEKNQDMKKILENLGIDLGKP